MSIVAALLSNLIVGNRADGPPRTQSQSEKATTMKKSDLRLILSVDAALIAAQLRDGANGFVPTQEFLGADVDGPQVTTVLDNAGFWFGPRDTLEKRTDFRQVIPYVLTEIDGKVVAYERTPKGGEARLHGKLAIGLGGHIDISDAEVSSNGHFSFYWTLRNAARRELLEEIGEHNLPTAEGADNVTPAEMPGLILMNDTEVDQVHVGVVFVQRMEKLPARETEDAIGNLQILSVAELAAQEDRLENWTKSLLPHLPALLARS